jgi:hypothetical protein
MPNFDPGPVPGGLFSFIPSFMVIFIIIFIAIILYTVLKGAKKWSYNNKQPVLTVESKIVSKRQDVSVNHHTGVHKNMHNHTTTNTNYYVTFEVGSGDRMEFHIPGKEYGLLAEDDMGKLTFQGSRYLGFVRNVGEV